MLNIGQMPSPEMIPHKFGRESRGITGKIAGGASSLIARTIDKFSQVLGARNAVDPGAYNLMRNLHRMNVAADDQSVAAVKEPIINEEESAAAVDLEAVPDLMSRMEAKKRKVAEHLDQGFGMVNDAVDKATTLNDISQDNDLENALGELKLPNEGIASLNYWANLRMNCKKTLSKIDQESQKLSDLQTQLESLKSELDQKLKAQEQVPIELQEMYNSLYFECEAQEAKVEALKEGLAKEAVVSLVSKGGDYLSIVQDNLSKGSESFNAVGSVADQIGIMGALVSLAKSISKMVTVGNSIEQLKKTRAGLESYMEDLDVKNPEDKLIYKMCFRKIDHLNKSLIILNQQAVSAAANILSSSLKSGQMAAAFAAAASTSIAAVPGLNIAAASLTGIVALGSAGLAVRNKLKHNREGVKLSLHAAQLSAEITVHSSRVFSKGTDLESLKKNIVNSLSVKQQLAENLEAVKNNLGSARLGEKSKVAMQKLEQEFSVLLEKQDQEQEKLSIKYEIQRNELCEMNSKLDQLLIHRDILRRGRDIEKISSEFSELIGTQELTLFNEEFENAFADGDVKQRFIDILRQEGIPIILDDFIFGSVLNFIRNDSVTLKSLETE